MSAKTPAANKDPGGFFLTEAAVQSQTPAANKSNVGIRKSSAIQMQGSPSQMSLVGT